MSDVVRLTGDFDRELRLVGVAGVEDVDIEEEREGIGRGSAAMSLAKIVFILG